MSEERVVIESRIQLFSALAEAAELEHNLMCLYLYAMFALKRCESEGVSPAELETIERWRKVILGISLEEMSHLSLVANLTSSLGGSPHFTRPNFPASPGYYPADMVIELAPFDLKTIEHFIFLERPAAQEMNDADTFKSEGEYERVAPHGRLMSSSGDYKTVGALYEAIREALVHLSQQIGERELFCGNNNRQITPIDSPLPGLIAIKDLTSALTAIETIISQGEGATTVKYSHFERFKEMRSEFLRLLEINPSFAPGRKVARNPVMRKPLQPRGRVWVNHPVSARYMDLANAFYNFMLRVLVQVYLIEDRERAEKHQLLEMSFSLMHMTAVIGEALTLLPTSPDQSDHSANCCAGMSFAMVRTLTPLAKENELEIMIERLTMFSAVLKSLHLEIEKEESIQPLLKSCVSQLKIAQGGIDRLMEGAVKLQQLRHGQALRAPEPSVTNAPESTVDVETADSSQIRIQFVANKCIHTRHCVTELPGVFKANTPGKWLFPEKADPEILAAVMRECPSGALTYESKGPLKNEDLPPVNLMRIYENGPYAFTADMSVDGKKAGYRATLCRCGQSRRKPFCDHSHADAGFLATGEPATVSDMALAVRDGLVKIDRTENGPLALNGNVEICAATGRVVLRTSSVSLCRCGHSKSKPICDGTHAVIGFKD